MKDSEALDEQIKDAIATMDLANLHKFISIVGINHKLKDEDGDTLLLYALSDSGSIAYKPLLTLQPDLSLSNNKGETVIHSCVYSCDIARLTTCVNLAYYLIDRQDKDGTTPLLLAILLANDLAALHLIKMGADVNIPDNENNLPIHAAAHLGNERVVRAVAEKTKDLLSKTKKGNTALAIAANQNNVPIVKLLYGLVYGEQ